MAQEQTPESKSSTDETPQVKAAFTRTPDGGWRSTVNVSFQVTNTWEQADGLEESPTSRKGSSGSTGGGGGTKTGVGAVPKAGGDDDDQPGDDTRAGLRAEMKSGA